MKNGFTLVEMAIVLLIVGLLLAGLITPISTQIQQRRIGATQDAMNEIAQALYGFALANGRLPCPATPTIPTGTAGAGTEATTGAGPTLACTLTTGVLPWATLGVSETDAWGQRYTYRVTALFGRGIPQTTFGCAPASNPTQASFALCTPGDMTVLATTGGAPLASNIPGVIVSHGPNGFGGYNTAGTQVLGAAGVDEQTNFSGGTTFVSHTPTATFDDLVTWISPNTLMNRMVSGGKLP